MIGNNLSVIVYFLHQSRKSIYLSQTCFWQQKIYTWKYIFAYTNRRQTVHPSRLKVNTKVKKKHYEKNTCCFQTTPQYQHTSKHIFNIWWIALSIMHVQYSDLLCLENSPCSRNYIASYHHQQLPTRSGKWDHIILRIHCK